VNLRKKARGKSRANGEGKRRKGIGIRRMIRASLKVMYKGVSVFLRHPLTQRLAEKAFERLIMLLTH
jgi:hypothetical protein